MNKERLEQLLIKGADVLTSDERKEVRTACKEAGLEVKFRGGCANCYSDALILLAKHHGVTLAHSETATASGKYVFVGKEPIMWVRFGKGAERICGDSTDDIIEQFRAKCPKLFEENFKIADEQGKESVNE